LKQLLNNTGPEKSGSTSQQYFFIVPECHAPAPITEISLNFLN
jgi:hypothetical protein